MKIADSTNNAPSAITQWVNSLILLADQEFLSECACVKQWEFEELEDLSPLIPLLNKIDSLLVLNIESNSLKNLSILLDFSSVLISSAHTKSLYNSLPELLTILDLPSWDLIFKTLKLLKKIFFTSKFTKNKKNHELVHKLYVIGLGSNINNSYPVSLQELCSDTKIERIKFQTKEEYKSEVDLPENLKYIWINRERMNRSLGDLDQQQLMVACQLLSISIFLQLRPESSVLQDFCKSLPEIWLIPALSDLVRKSISLEVHTSALSLISSIVFSLETSRKDAFYTHVSQISTEIFINWNLLILDLLESLSSASITMSESADFFTTYESILSILDLAGVISECKHKSDLFNLQTMTSALITLLRSPEEIQISFHPNILTKIVKVLNMLLFNTMNMFKEADGMMVTLQLILAQTRILYNESKELVADVHITRHSRIYLIKSLLKLIKTALVKWEPIPNRANTEIRLIIEKGFLEIMVSIFQHGTYEIYEEALVLLNQMVIEYETLIEDLVASGLIVSLLDSLEKYIPDSPKFIEILARFLCIIGSNMNCAKVIENYETVTKLLIVLGNSDTASLSNSIATNIAESLTDLFASVPKACDKAIDGHIQLVISIKSFDFSEEGRFFQKISNLSKVLARNFEACPELVKGFMARNGVDFLLEVFKIPVLPKSPNNEFFQLTACFRSLLMGLNSNVLPKLMQALNVQIQNFQDIVGTFASVKDFSEVSECHKKDVLHCLIEGDCYLDIVRLILHNWTSIAYYYKDFSELLEKISMILRVLIAEQARLLCLNRTSGKKCEKFNLEIDASVLENSESKSYEENLYFACQVSIRKVISLAMRIPNSRGRHSVNEEAGIAITRTIGQLFSKVFESMTLEEVSASHFYCLAMQLSDLIKTFFNEQGANPGTILTFAVLGGTDNFSRFLVQLKKISFEIKNAPDYDYDLINSLQILWTLSGKFLENLVNGKYLNSTFGQLILKSLGCESSKEIVKKMQGIGLEILQKLNYLECGVLSTSFARSVLEILKFVCKLSGKVSGSTDSNAIKAIVDMGFSAQVARQALKSVRSGSVELAIEWIYSHPEVLEQLPEQPVPEKEAIDNLHTVVISALPFIPSLHTGIAEILVKISGGQFDNQIALGLLGMTAHFASELLQENALLEITAGMFQIPDTQFQCSFEQLSACLYVIQNLIVKNSSYLGIFHENLFFHNLTKLLKKARIEHFQEKWVHNAFSLLDILFKSGENCTEDIVLMLISIVKQVNSSNVTFNETELHSLLNLLVTITYTPDLCKVFINNEGLENLLLIKSKPENINKNLNSAWGILLKQLCEDPLILQVSFQVQILQALNGKQVLEHFLKNFKSEVSRSKDIFSLALQNVCNFNKKDQVYIEKKKKIEGTTAESWPSITIICNVLTRLFEADQLGPHNHCLNTEKLISLIGDLFQTYPRLISAVEALKIDSKSFFSYLVNTIIPFRYSLKIKNNKMLLFYPNTSVSVTSEVFQNWVNVCVKLLRTLTIKQCYKQPESSISEIYSEIFLDSNSAVAKARKVVVKELHDIFVEHLKIPWAENEFSMTLIRSSAMIIMQLLRERPKPPFAANGCVELARILISDKTCLIRLLSEAAKGINLSFKRSESLYNLLLGPLELLTKYQLNFILKGNKPLESNIEVYPMEMDNNSESEAHENQEVDELNSSEVGEDHQDDIVLERWNNTYWAEEFEDDEDYEVHEIHENVRENFHRLPLPDPRPQETYASERLLFEVESPQPFLHYRSIFRDFDVNIPDRVQAFLMRANMFNHENPPAEVPEPVFHRVFPNANENLRLVSASFSEIAEPVLEEVKQEEPPGPVHSEVLQNLSEVSLGGALGIQPAEERFVPEGIDPLVFEALPDDIRNEILAQYQRPPREQSLNAEFLQALPPDVRDELISQSRPTQRQPAEMDNATFVASLTPDLRREVLITATEDFLNTLPAELVAEARLLQERISQRENYLIGRVPQAPKKKVASEEDKTISEIVADEKLVQNVPLADDHLLEVLFKSFYLLVPVNREIISSLLLNYSVNPVSRSKILDGLISLLVTVDCYGEFPPKTLYGSDVLLPNNAKVYGMVSLRLLDTLMSLVKNNPKVPNELISPLTGRLPIIKRDSETQGFKDLITMLDFPLFKTSPSHLSSLILLVSTVLNRLTAEIPSLDQSQVDRICNLLSFESLNETNVKIVVDLVTKLSQQESNKFQVVQALRNQIKIIAKDVLFYILKNETSPNGFKELQVLRICKVVNGVDTISDDIDFLWEPLSNTVTRLTSKENSINIASPVLSKLLPLIESFFITHYSRPNTESFHMFTSKTSKIINLLIRQNPNLLNETFNSLVKKFPELLEFENKRVYFRSEMQKMRPERGYDSIKLSLRRAEVFKDSFNQLKIRSAAEMHGKLRIQFVGEEGLDAGGLTREWFGLLSQEMFNPNYALFIPSPNGVSFQPNYMSSIHDEHIQYFNFIGRIIGKALADEYVLNVYFTRSFYKHILGQEVTYQDMEDLDVNFYKSLKALMEINLNENDFHEYYFAHEEEKFGKISIVELVQDGKNKRVTEENKIEYIKLLCNMKMTKNIQAQIDAFKAGFHELVPKELISIFDSKELELLISGLPNIDLEDLQSNTEYHNYTKDSQVIVWFWEVLHEFEEDERAEFLQFVTGSSKVPLDGFKALPGMGGFQKFQIHKCFASTDRLPTAHTCMNQLDLPEYQTKEKLKNRLKFAISEGKEGFGFV